jgi:hypothetical protein
MGAIASCMRRAPPRAYNDGLVSHLFPTINNVESFAAYVRYAKDNDHAKLIYSRTITSDTPLLQRVFHWPALTRVSYTFNAPGNSKRDDFPLGPMASPDAHGANHIILTIMSADWRMFNVTTVAMHHNGLDFLQRLKSIAENYSTQRGWTRVGYYVHCYPHTHVAQL